jgi:hypothetical protein
VSIQNHISHLEFEGPAARADFLYVVVIVFLLNVSRDAKASLQSNNEPKQDFVGPLGSKAGVQYYNEPKYDCAGPVGATLGGSDGARSPSGASPPFASAR